MAMDKHAQPDFQPASRLRAGLVPVLCAAAVLAACSSVPEPNERLIAAQSALERARADPPVPS